MGIRLCTGVAALALSLAAGPVFAQSETTYIACDVQEYGSMVLRLKISGSQISEWREWAANTRDWKLSHAACGADVSLYGTATCTASASDYTWDWTMKSASAGNEPERYIRINRQTGAYVQRDGNIRQGTDSLVRGVCQGAENPELAPASSPIL